MQHSRVARCGQNFNFQRTTSKGLVRAFKIVLIIPTDATQALAQFLAENGWNTSDGLKAIRSLRNLYRRETKTEAGRCRWHGRRKRVTVDAATGRRISVYEDGETFVDERQSAKTAKAATTDTGGIPAALARQRAEASARKATTNEVNVVITN